MPIVQEDIEALTKAEGLDVNILLALQLLLRQEYPNLAGFLDCVEVPNICLSSFLNQGICQFFLIQGKQGKLGHYNFCFGLGSDIFYFCSKNKKKVPDGVISVMGNMFCSKSEPKKVVRRIPLVSQRGQECCARVFWVCCQLAVGLKKGDSLDNILDKVKRLKPPCTLAQHDLISRCLTNKTVSPAIEELSKWPLKKEVKTSERKNTRRRVSSSIKPKPKQIKLQEFRIHYHSSEGSSSSASSSSSSSSSPSPSPSFDGPFPAFLLQGPDEGNLCIFVYIYIFIYLCVMMVMFRCTFICIS